MVITIPRRSISYNASTQNMKIEKNRDKKPTKPQIDWPFPLALRPYRCGHDDIKYSMVTYFFIEMAVAEVLIFDFN